MYGSTSMSILTLLAGMAWARPKIEIPEAGRIGKSRLEELLLVPGDLARQPRDSQQLWMELADSSIVLAARTEGFLDARCGISLAELDSAADRITVRVQYYEGPEYRYGKISFNGPDGSQDPPIPPKSPVSTGDGFRPSRTSDLLQDAQQYYRRHGWLDASVEPELQLRRDSSLVDVKLTVNLGRIAIFESIDIRFRGKHLTNPDILKGLWPLAPGDTIRYEDIAKYNRKLGQTRLYNMARVQRVPGQIDPSRTTITVDLAERVPGSIDFGLSWEPKFGWGLDGTIRHRNFNGTLNELSFEGIMAEHRQKARAGAGTPLFLGTAISFDYGFTLQQQDADLADSTVYREFRVGNEGTFSFLPTDWSNVSLNLNTDRVTKFPYVGATKVQYQFQTGLGGLLDFRNDPFEPTRGWTLRTNLGWGGQLDNDTSYVWIQSQGRAYQPLFWRFLSAFALEGARFLNTTTSDGAASVIYLGGSRTVRSYTYRSLMAKPDPGQNLQPMYLRSSAELRMNLPWSFQAVGFVDWARIWNNGQDPDFTDLEKASIGYGTGLRYRLSLLSIRFDYSFGRGPEKWVIDLAQAI